MLAGFITRRGSVRIGAGVGGTGASLAGCGAASAGAGPTGAASAAGASVVDAASLLAAFAGASAAVVSCVGAASVCGAALVRSAAVVSVVCDSSAVWVTSLLIYKNSSLFSSAPWRFLSVKQKTREYGVSGAWIAPAIVLGIRQFNSRR